MDQELIGTYQGHTLYKLKCYDPGFHSCKLDRSSLRKAGDSGLDNEITDHAEDKFAEVSHWVDNQIENEGEDSGTQSFHYSVQLSDNSWVDITQKSAGTICLLLTLIFPRLSSTMISSELGVPQITRKLRHSLFLVLIQFCSGSGLVGQDLLNTDSFPNIRLDQYDDLASAVFLNDWATFITQGHMLHVHEKSGAYFQYNLVGSLPRKLRKQIDKRYPNRYYFRNDTLAMQNNRFVALFTISRKKVTPVFHHQIKSSKLGKEGVHFTGKELVTYGLYNEHPKSDGLRCGMLRIDLKTKHEEIQEFEFNALPLTHLRPNKFLSFNASMYALCDPINYKILIYEIGGKVLDSLSMDSPEFVMTDSLLRYFKKWDSPAYHSAPADKFSELNNAIKDKPRVWVCAMLNASTFFVRVSKPNPGSTIGFDMIDHVWKKQNGHWAISRSRTVNFEEHKGSADSVYPEFAIGHKLYFDNDLIHYSLFQDKAARQASGRDFYSPHSKTIEDLTLYIYSLKF